MNQGENLADIARGIIDSILYMVLGTAGESGQPWVSPVYYAASNYEEFYWMSSPKAKHSRNLAVRPQISIVIFDSRVAAGKGQAVYMTGEAAELMGPDVEAGLAIYNGRFPDPAQHGVQITLPEEVRPPADYRLYRAVAAEHWVLDPGAHPDQRTAVMVRGE